MKLPSASRCPRGEAGKRGFSLVEMLAVMAIITILMAMMAPAMRSFSDTAGRRGAVTTVMNTLEQARVAALESGRDVYVLFYRMPFPTEDRMMVVREPENGGPYDQLSKWLKLPKNVVFYSPTVGNSLFNFVLPTTFDANLPDKLKSSIAKPVGGLAAIKFNASGQASVPNNNSSQNLILHISEGVRDSSGVVARINEDRAGLPFEIITLSKYTGRAQLDVTELAASN